MAEPAEELVALPDSVHQRVVAMTAAALPQLAPDRLPPALRRVATFTPARRARLAHTSISAALDTDPAFRDRVATVVRSRHTELADAVADGSTLPAADPVEVAALTYLLRPAGWVEQVRTAGEQAERARSRHAQGTGRIEHERALRRVDEARAELHRARERHRGQLATVKGENSELRHRLAEVRQHLRQARIEAQTAVATADAVRGRAAGVAADAEAEVRRLRGRVAELEAAVAELRRDARGGRDAASTRARLLVETLESAAQGLRRELALPAVDVLPADTVEAVAPGVATGADAAGRMLRADDPAFLGQLLAIPRVHVIVDGYNVTKTGYAGLALDEQRARLVRDLAPVVARTGAEVTVVFDGADLRHPPPVAGRRGVRVRFSPPGVIADELIRQLVAVEPQGRPVVVVSTDREVVTAVVASGARAVPSSALLALLARA